MVKSEDRLGELVEKYKKEGVVRPDVIPIDRVEPISVTKSPSVICLWKHDKEDIQPEDLLHVICDEDGEILGYRDPDGTIWNVSYSMKKGIRKQIGFQEKEMGDITWL